MQSIERCHINTLNPDFKIISLFNAEYLRNGTRHIYNKILIGLGTYKALLKDVITNDLE